MNSFWVSAVLLALTVAMVLFLTTHSRKKSLEENGADERSKPNADDAFYKSQLLALEKDKASGLLGADQFRVAQAELAREALAAKKASEADAVAGKWPLSYSLIALVSFLAIGLTTYYYLGSPGFNNQPLATRLAAIEDLDVADAVSKIEAQLEVTPDDIRGWRVLVPVYARQGNVDKAINAFENIVRIEGENAENLTDLAEAYLMKAQGKPASKAVDLLRKAVLLDPRHIRSRFYLANIALNNEEYDVAKREWEDILALGKGDEAWFESAQSGLAASIAGLGESGPTAEEVEAATQMDEADRNQMIQQMVGGLAERLYAEGGRAQDWALLIRSRMALGQIDQAHADIEKARAAFESNGADKDMLEEAIAPFIDQLKKEQKQ